MKVCEIETPAVLADIEIMDRNTAEVQRVIRGASMSLYPHYKSHKCVQLAAYQMEHGAKGITCAKLSEAEDLVAGGIKTVIIANQVIQQQKLCRLATLARKSEITVCVDEAENVLALERACAAEGATLRVLIEYEVGMQRCGVESFENALALARLIAQQEHLSFDGIQAYAGQLSHESDAAVRKAELLKAEKTVAALKDYLEANGCSVENICGGSTGTAADKPKNTVYTQLQTGSYLLMDASYQKLALSFQQAMFVATTVISAKKDRIVVDCGVKSLAMDQYPPLFIGYENCAYSFSEEHTTIFADGHHAAVGDRILCIPGHCCTTNNCFEKIYLIRGDDVAAVCPINSHSKAQ